MMLNIGFKIPLIFEFNLKTSKNISKGILLHYTNNIIKLKA